MVNPSMTLAEALRKSAAGRTAAEAYMLQQAAEAIEWKDGLLIRTKPDPDPERDPLVKVARLAHAFVNHGLSRETLRKAPDDCRASWDVLSEEKPS